MNTYLECIPCFFRQALDIARISGAEERVQKNILDDTAGAVIDFSLDQTPPEMALIIHGIVKNHTGLEDPYRQLKIKSNTLAMRLLPQVQRQIDQSSDRLFTACELAILGNVIDYGAKNSLDVEKELDDMVARKNGKRNQPGELFDYQAFREALFKHQKILYLADNAGETAFDKLLIQEIKRLDPSKKIIYAVKEKPIINDALREDALFCGIDEVADIISSGADVPGTVLSRCSESFRDLFYKADMVISKGQGNFEALSKVNREIFFLFKAKCPVLARHVGSELGAVVLKHHRGEDSSASS